MGVFANGKLVSVGAFMPWKWRIDKRVIDGAQSGDTATHPDWERKGQFSAVISKLTELSMSDTESWAFGTPNRASLTPYLRLGWESLGASRQLIRLRRPLAGGMAALGFPKTRIDPLDPGRHLATLAPVVQALAEDGVEELIERCLDSCPGPATHRSTQYMRWRYEAPGWLGYGALAHIQGSEGALVIGRVTTRGTLRVLLLSETLATPGQLGRRLLRELIGELASAADADYITACAGNDSPETAVLLGSGFVPIGRRGPLVIARSLNRNATSTPAALKVWRLSFGDLEVL